MTDKDLYIANSFNLPLFHQAFWLNAVTGNNWDVALVKNADSQIIASMPYYYKKGKINMPFLTQFSGPHIWVMDDKSYYQQLSSEHKILSDLLHQLPNFNYFEQRWHYNYQNWLPFYWNGFSQTTKYTYVLNNVPSIEEIWKQMKPIARNEINKAEEKINIIVNNEIEPFYHFLKENAYRKIGIPFPMELLKNIYSECDSEKSIELSWAVNDQNEKMGAILIVWDKSTCYYLLGSTNDNSPYALRLLLWRAIKNTHIQGLDFNFEGSMIKGVEHFFRSFGAIQKPYFELTKTNSRLLQIKQGINVLKKAIF